VKCSTHPAVISAHVRVRNDSSVGNCAYSLVHCLAHHRPLWILQCPELVDEEGCIGWRVDEGLSPGFNQRTKGAGIVGATTWSTHLDWLVPRAFVCFPLIPSEA
jgi:hypothetical protein